MKNEFPTVSDLADLKRSKVFPIKYNDYTIEVAERKQFHAEQMKIFSKVFPPGPGYKPGKKEEKNLQPCYEEYRKIHSERFLIKHKGKVVGWIQGEMEDFETFYLRNSGILPSHQGKGIYSAFSEKFEKYIFSLGYTRISSQHAPMNAKMLSIKLKSGFVIVGNEFHERWGSLIKVVKFSSKKRKDYYLKRVD